jgi:hypothetical protein
MPETEVLFATILAIIFGTFGLIQGMVLQHRVQLKQRRVVASGLGGLLGGLLCASIIAIYGNIGVLITPAVGFAVIGVAQGIMLRHTMRYPFLWPVVQAVAAELSSGIAVVGGVFVRLTFELPVWSVGIGGIIVFVLVYGIITGILLRWLLPRVSKLHLHPSGTA